MFHVVCVTNRIANLVTSELSWQTLILATSKFIKSCQADLWSGYASEKHKCGTISQCCRWGWVMGPLRHWQGARGWEKARGKSERVPIPESLCRVGESSMHMKWASRFYTKCPWEWVILIQEPGESNRNRWCPGCHLGDKEGRTGLPGWGSCKSKGVVWLRCWGKGEVTLRAGAKFTGTEVPGYEGSSGGLGPDARGLLVNNKRSIFWGLISSLGITESVLREGFTVWAEKLKASVLIGWGPATGWLWITETMPPHKAGSS